MAETDVITKDNQMFLNPAFMAEEIAQIQDPELWFKSAGFSNVSTRSNTVRFMEDPYSPGTDPLKRRAPVRQAGSFFSRMDISSVTFRSTVLTPYGISFAIDEDTVSDPSMIDYFRRGRVAMARWLAEQKNNLICDALTGNWSLTDGNELTSIVTGAGYTTAAGVIHAPVTTTWSTASTDVVSDIIGFQKLMSTQTGRRYLKLTDAYMSSIDYFNLYERLLEQDSLALPMPNKNDVNVDIKIAGISFHEMKGTLTDANGDEVTGKAIFIDRNANPITIYNKFNPRYARAGDVMVNTYEDPASHDTIVQAWFNTTVERIQPKAVLIASNLS